MFTSLKESTKVLDITTIDNILIKDFMELIKELLNKENYSSLEILNITNTINYKLQPIYSNIIQYVINNALNNKKKVLLYLLNSIVLICKKYEIFIIKPPSSNDNIGLIKNSIKEIIQNNCNKVELLKEVLILIQSVNSNPIYNYLINADRIIGNIINQNNEIIEYICSFNSLHLQKDYCQDFRN